MTQDCINTTTTSCLLICRFSTAIFHGIWGSQMELDFFIHLFLKKVARFLYSERPGVILQTIVSQITAQLQTAIIHFHHLHLLLLLSQES